MLEYKYKFHGWRNQKTIRMQFACLCFVIKNNESLGGDDFRQNHVDYTYYYLQARFKTLLCLYRCA